MSVKYCNAECQKKHWATHKAACKLRAAELRDEALFKDPPSKEDCSICFLSMPAKMISCVSLPPATLTSVPIYDYSLANEEAAKLDMEQYYQCCGKTICKGCIYSFCAAGNIDKCPFCNSDRGGKTREEKNKDLMKRVDANDAASIYLLANSYQYGLNGFQQDQMKAIELYARSAELGCSKAHHNQLGGIYDEGGNLKKAKFHFEAAAMAGYEVARYNIGSIEFESGNIERAVKHWTIAASGGEFRAMHHLRILFEKGHVSKESIDSTLAAYNNSCADMRSEARDACIQIMVEGAQPQL
jgi:TPR repeat protein